jgi:hypothetical protein
VTILVCLALAQCKPIPSSNVPTSIGSASRCYTVYATAPPSTTSSNTGTTGNGHVSVHASFNSCRSSSTYQISVPRIELATASGRTTATGGSTRYSRQSRVDTCRAASSVAYTRHPTCEAFGCDKRDLIAVTSRSRRMERAQNRCIEAQGYWHRERGLGLAARRQTCICMTK